MELDAFDSLSTVQEVHNCLRKKICLDYLPNYPKDNRKSFLVFKANSRNYLSVAEYSLDDPTRIFDALETKGKIRPGEYSTLKWLVDDADKRILGLIYAAEKRIKQIIDASKVRKQNNNQRAELCDADENLIHKENGHFPGTMPIIVVFSVCFLAMVLTKTAHSENNVNYCPSDSFLSYVMKEISDFITECKVRDTKALPEKPPTNNTEHIQDIVGDELRILLIGKTGVGKSTTGNRILGRNKFKTDTSDESVTSETTLGQASRVGKKLMVVDTPGLFDTKRSNEETISEIIKCYGITAPGLHAILLIQDVGRMTDEQIKTIEIFEERFGKNLDRFLILVFTGKDKLTSQRKTLNEYVHGLQTDSNLKKLLKRIDYRFTGLSLNGDEKDLEDEINDLMGMVQSLVDKNKGQYYTNDMYRQAEQVLLERLAEVKRKEKERRDKEIGDALRNERERHAGIEQSLQDEIQRKENELAKQKKKDDFFDKAKKEWERFRRRGISW